MLVQLVVISLVVGIVLSALGVSPFDIINSLADGPDHVIPGHDPLILKRFPKLNGNPEIVRLDLPPVA